MIYFQLFLSFLGKNKKNRSENLESLQFLWYDKEKGWSEKRYRNNVYFFEDISREWPSCWNDRTVGAFKITR